MAWLTQNIVNYLSGVGGLRQQQEANNRRSTSRPRAKTTGAKISHGLSVSTIVCVESRPQPSTTTEVDDSETTDGHADLEKGFIFPVPESAEHYANGPARMIETQVEDGRKAVCLAVTLDLSGKVADAVVCKRRLRRTETQATEQKNALMERRQELYSIAALLTDDMEDIQCGDRDEQEKQILVAELLQKRTDANDEMQWIDRRTDYIDRVVEDERQEYLRYQDKVDLILDDVWTKCDLLDPDKEPKEETEENVREQDAEGEVSADARSETNQREDPGQSRDESHYDAEERMRDGASEYDTAQRITLADIRPPEVEYQPSFALSMDSADLRPRDGEGESDFEQRMELLAIEANVALKDAWHAKTAAELKYENHERTYGQQEYEYIDAQVNRAHLDLAGEYSLLHLAEGMRLTGNIVEAENTYYQIKRAARKVGCDAAYSVASSYYGEANHGYGESAERLEIEACDRKRIDKWMSTVDEKDILTTSPFEGLSDAGDTPSAVHNEVEISIRIRRELRHEDTVMADVESVDDTESTSDPFDTWDSVSILAFGRHRQRIEKWAAKKGVKY